MMHIDEIINRLDKCIQDGREYIAKSYKDDIDNNRLDRITDITLEHVAKGGYVHDYGFEGVDEGYKPYYEYLKQDLDNRKNNIYEEYNEQQLLLEDNNYNNTNIVQYEYIPQQYNYSYDYNTYNNYYTPYSYEYEPYIDYYNNEYYNTYYNDNTVNTTVDLTNNNTNTFNNAITNVLDMIKSYKDTVNIFKPIKKKIINYISNYRPMYNSITGKIEAVLIE